MKPYKGEILDWKIIVNTDYNEGLGFKVLGSPRGHPTIKNWILTSEVVAYKPTEWKDGRWVTRIETLNSIYDLIGGDS